MKTKGILLPVYSLPGKYGIGEFSREAFLFIDFLKENGFTEWYILPFDFDPIYISLDDLYSRELIALPFEFKTLKRTISYKQVSRLKNTYFFEAYCNYSQKNGLNEIKEYGAKNKHVLEHCKNEVVKSMNGQKNNEKEAIFLNYYLFMQMVLSQEWNYIKNHAKNCGVEIIDVNPEDAHKYLTVLDVLKLNKKFTICKLNENNKCFKLRNFKKLFKLLKNVDND
mgnify:CR=1 FL=1